ncbi:sigma 54-interacting transcriptional regulator [Seleniivibrio sp.]|uniref:sigma 54-interacting transcriptional regulator n=1 Tax=Seleniivibrio sp. TaxID=2898801 RepID=UPI0025F1E22C|nr:sigma 54-interacting transcriptional regulator [Seleniivibrio sp.]MCD8552502.1 sigma 54-interacting transcriptional regulator [Seleniivibrio sp.]
MNIDENEFFKEITLRICGSLDIKAALSKVYDYIRNIMPLDNIYLAIHDDELGAIRFIAAVPNNSNLTEDTIIPLNEELWEITRALKHPMIKDIDNPLPFVQKMVEITKDEGNSSIIVPLHIDDTKLGTLALRALGNRRYNQDHLKLISIVTDPFTIALANALAHKDLMNLKDRLVDENQFLQNELTSKYHEDIIGSKSGLRNVMEMVSQVAQRNNTVLLLGETGVGKEVIANAIHYNSARKNQPFIKVNCGAIPEALIDTELFGHEKGAFTGATAMKRGRFERAEGGTIFLDEIGELPLQAQVRLLRVLQNRELERVGGSTPIPLNIRIIAATHKKLEDMVAEGGFREDLWFRLNVFPIYIPPLRNRKEDIPALARYFIEQKCREIGLHQTPPIEIGTLEKLANYSWPGNVRELQNVIERELIRFKTGKLTFSSITADRLEDRKFVRSQAPDLIPENLDVHTADYISQVLNYTGGKINGKGGAAEILGLKPSTLRSKMAKLDVRRK